MSLKSEMTAFEKADIDDEVSHPLSKLPATPITAQSIPLRGLRAPNDDPELTVKYGHAWSPRIHLDLELAIKDHHAGSQRVRLWPQVDF